MLHNMFTSFSPAASASVFIFKALCFSYRLRVLICMEKLERSEEWMLFYNRVCIQGFSSRFEVECMYETTDSSTSHAYFWGWLLRIGTKGQAKSNYYSLLLKIMDYSCSRLVELWVQSGSLSPRKLPTKISLNSQEIICPSTRPSPYPLSHFSRSNQAAH